MMTATLEIFTPHQPTSPAQPFDQDDHEAIIFACVALLIKTDQTCSLLYDLNSQFKGSLCLHPLFYFNQMVKANKNRPNPQALDDPSQLCAEDQLLVPSAPPPMAPTALEESV